jgi:hypothetical protein
MSFSTGTFIDARKYGITGDGTTDNFAAFNSANAEASASTSGARTILVPPGNYLIASNLTFSANVKVAFDEGASLKPASNTTVVLRTIQADLKQNIFDVSAGGTIQFTPTDYVSVAWFGAKGDGIADDTAAIQATLNFTMGSNPIVNAKAYCVYFPQGTYNISSSLTWTGNYGSSLRVVGHNSGQQFGTYLNWVGTAGGVMWHFYAANGCYFEHIAMSGLNTANCCMWFHTYNPQTTIALASNGQTLPTSTINVASTAGFYAPGNVFVATNDGYQTVSYTGLTPTSFTGCTGGIGTMSTGGGVYYLIDSFNNKFEHCYFEFCSGSTASDGTGAVMVKCGDNNVTTAVAQFIFHFCTFVGTGFNDGQTFACVQPMQAGSGNTETFSFYDCQLSNAQYCFYFNFAKNQCLFSECQFGTISKAVIFVSGDSQVHVFSAGCESGVPSGPYAHKGLFLSMGGGGDQGDSAIIESSEIVMDGYANVSGSGTPGVLFAASGRLTIRDCIIDATQGGSSGFNNVIPSIVSNGLPVGSLPGSTVIVEQCEIVNTGLHNNQLLVQDTSGNDYTNSTAVQIPTNIYLRGNTGNTFGGNFVALPDFIGNPPTMWSLGPYLNQTISPYFAPSSALVASQTRVSTSVYQLDYTNTTFTQNSGSVLIYPCSLKPRTAVLRVIIEVVTPFKGGSITGVTVSFGNQNDAVTYNRYIQASDIWTGAAFYGLVNSDLGVGLARATNVQGCDMGNFLTVNSSTIAQFTSTGQNFGTGSATHLTQGSLKIYLTTEMVG